MTFKTKNASDIMLAAPCSSRRKATKYVLTYVLTLKSQCQNLTSGQDHVRSCAEPSRSYCKSVDASLIKKLDEDDASLIKIGTIPNALFVFSQKLERKKMTSHDLERRKERLLGQNCIWVIESVSTYDYL